MKSSKTWTKKCQYRGDRIPLQELFQCYDQGKIGTGLSSRVNGRKQGWINPPIKIKQNTSTTEALRDTPTFLISLSS